MINLHRFVPHHYLQPSSLIALGIIVGCAIALFTGSITIDAAISIVTGCVIPLFVSDTTSPIAKANAMAQAIAPAAREVAGRAGIEGQVGGVIETIAENVAKDTGGA